MTTYMPEQIEATRRVNEWLNHPPPEERARRDVVMRRTERIAAITKPLRRIPFVGGVIAAFWFSVLNDGIHETIAPRWGVMTFSFMGDSDKVSLWHTWQEITDPEGPYSGVWLPRRNPRNKAEADHVLARHSGKNWTRKCGEWCEEVQH